ncbi:MAG: peptide-methionine (S)-S-oxide reductase MsrA [Phycisphaerae bacterium]|nr:peptide-methionine (S)-S-oxide reductase MsrA [Phycisphaerae bacterium]MDW8263633.1 peptide-methionine (S)-S-oxide reductase MsrA [Phycisphaerales bacterium]
MNRNLIIGVITMLASMFGGSCGRGGVVDYSAVPDPKEDLSVAPDAGPQTLVLAGGCFWCVEGVFEQIPGVLDVVSGYAGDTEASARYELVSNGQTNHAEAVRITYDPSRITFGRLLKVFFSIAHDPTTLNRQGPDIGRQYRSAVFYADPEQKRLAEAYIRQLEEARVFDSPIVTTLEPLNGFYPAEDYHQDFVRNHPRHGYVMQQALPKVAKAKKVAEQLAPASRPAG